MAAGLTIDPFWTGIIGTAIGGGIVFFMNKATNKLAKKDCADCKPVNELQAEIIVVRQVVLRIASGLGIDVKQYEDLVK